MNPQTSSPVVNNWRTSLVGLIGGGLTMYAQTGFHHFDWNAFIPSVTMLLLGILAKDAHNPLTQTQQSALSNANTP